MMEKLNYLDIAHRNVAWFNSKHQAGELDIQPPFQRNPVWTTPQKSYLIDSILHGLPVPELYMQESVDADGRESYVIIDGQQRIRACLEYVEGRFDLSEKDSPEWAAARFDDLTEDERKKIFGYKFVVRTLPDLPLDQLRDIFKRLNRNVVVLNAQELRHATYWGPFISMVEREAEDNSFWAESGLFTAQGIRRMDDVEYVSELAVAVLHGPQARKRLDHFYQLYEESFESRQEVVEMFRVVTGEIHAILPDRRGTRWAKKSDFYSLFLAFTDQRAFIPLASEQREALQRILSDFESQVTEFLSIDAAGEAESAEEIEKKWPTNVVRYAKAVAGAASDLVRRQARQKVLTGLFNSAITRKGE